MSTMTSISNNSFSQLAILPRLVNRLEQLHISQPTAIQQQAIPPILDGKDVLAGAQTGTGKTAAYGLPLIQMLDADRDINAPRERQVKALVLVPTRELAQQVLETLQSYAEGTPLTIMAVYGGTSMNVQVNQLATGVDILIATPGRLLDHAHLKTVILSRTATLVLDEADRMLDMGFMPDIQRVLRRLPDERQTLFFSATFAGRVKSIAYKLLNNPVEVQVTPSNSTADTVEQMVYPVDRKRKRALLAFLIGSRNWQQVLVFVRTKQSCDVLVNELKLDGIKAASIHGDKSQGARLKALNDFKTGKIRALIATDVAARGLDISELEQVVNYDMPYKAEDYIHRIGRTGRAGHSGCAVSLMSREEQPMLNAIEQLIDQRLPQEWLAGFEPSPFVSNESDAVPRRRSRAFEKRQLKAKLKIHANRGKNKKKRND